MGWIFRCMEIVEEELAGRDQPGAFMLLCPNDVLGGKAEWLYRSHVRELLDRLEIGMDTRPGTDAECLAALMTVVTAMPVTERARAAVHELWSRVAPDGIKERGLGDLPPTREVWEGSNEECIEDVRKRMAQPERKVAKQ
jgi:hypothetical protein